MSFFNISLLRLILQNSFVKTFKTFFVLTTIFFLQFYSFGVEPSETKNQYSVFVDENDESFYWVSFAHIPTSSYETYGNRGQIEFSGQIKAFQFQNIAGGTLNIDYLGNLFLFKGKVKADLPDQLFRLVMEPKWTGRFSNGINLQIKAQPGIYNDMKRWSSSALFVPFGVTVIKDYSDELSGFIGIDIRHDFRNKVMPVAGIKWAPFEIMRITAGIQDGDIDISLSNINFYGRWNWQNISFRKEHGSSGEGLVTLEDCRLTVGLMVWLRPDMHFFCEAGRILGREMNIGRHSTRADSEITVGESQIIKIGIGGPF